MAREYCLKVGENFQFVFDVHGEIEDTLIPYIQDRENGVTSFMMGGGQTIISFKDEDCMDKFVKWADGVKDILVVINVEIRDGYKIVDGQRVNKVRWR